MSLHVTFSSEQPVACPAVHVTSYLINWVASLDKHPGSALNQFYKESPNWVNRWRLHHTICLCPDRCILCLSELLPATSFLVCTPTNYRSLLFTVHFGHEIIGIYASAPQAANSKNHVCAASSSPEFTL